ncbi:Hypothetical Protein FCC1311_091892 [Hondaea fermentalgiana]|uniref:Alpha-L-rhamnosidase six-hairpin glycosidase domain-containing protein n=1 Tax=Hondaea fermentalgiana TaxID=2315210 RepID=A0A2R5GWC2_9STRA|nr:Hypothetical Protein FCC1311_091892 [Hondaea fermentalgiana]|eukprot:GBG32963.1 Hypothetical Protein FCC1311_091892 [Hondaea fermentalgiana]
MAGLALFSLALFSLALTTASAEPVACKLHDTTLRLVHNAQGEAVLQNGFVCLQTQRGSITSIQADFAGKAGFGANVLANQGIVLHRESSATGDAVVESGRAEALIVLKDTATEKSIQIVHVGDEIAAENWTLSLRAESQEFVFEASGSVLADAPGTLVRSWDFAPASIYAFYNASVVQMLNAPESASSFASRTPLQRVYALGASGSERDAVGNKSIDLLFSHNDAPMRANTYLRSSVKSRGTGFVEHLAGSAFPAGGDASLDKWTTRPAPSASSAMKKGTAWKHTVRVAANNFDFPAGAGLRKGLQHEMPLRDLVIYMTALYGSPVGTLMTHANAIAPGQQVAHISPTIASPKRGYAGNYNFFDPDSYLGTAALLWSHDAFLQDQVRRVIERNGDFINEKGQIPHHFIDTKPVYAAISNEIQTGPNLFWILSAFNYAKSSGNLAWLRDYMPKLRDASRFLFDMIHPQLKLASVPGSLMIDVFLRSNYTTDTNAALVFFFDEFAAAEDAVGNATGAENLRLLASQIRSGVDAHLWREDHYVTQWDFPSNTSFRDFVDYDANLLAASFVANASRAQQIFRRIDGGKCQKAPTWVSEIYYGPKDTASGNVGDSACAMGRIAWFNALARRRFGDLDTFENGILSPLMRLLEEHTWMRERLNCDGSQNVGRTLNYFEYPSVVVMLLHHVRYGVHMGYREISIEPFGPEVFALKMGQVLVEFFPQSVTRLQFPAGSEKSNVTYRLAPVPRDAVYHIDIGVGQENAPRRTVASVWDPDTNRASLIFEAPVGPLVIVTRATSLKYLREQS